MEVFLSTYNIKIMRKPISIRLNGHNKLWIICWHVLSIFWKYRNNYEWFANWIIHKNSTWVMGITVWALNNGSPPVAVDRIATFALPSSIIPSSQLKTNLVVGFENLIPEPSLWPLQFPSTSHRVCWGSNTSCRRETCPPPNSRDSTMWTNLTARATVYEIVQ